MTYSRRKVLIGVVAMLTLVAVLSTSGCDKNKIQCAVKASEKVVRVADKAPVIVEQLAAEGALEPADAEVIKRLAAEARVAAEEFGNVARSMSEDTPDNREQLRAAAQQLVASIRRLDSEGVLRVKDEKARARLRTALALAEVAAELAI